VYPHCGISAVGRGAGQKEPGSKNQSGPEIGVGKAAATCGMAVLVDRLKPGGWNHSVTTNSLAVLRDVPVHKVARRAEKVTKSGGTNISKL